MLVAILAKKVLSALKTPIIKSKISTKPSSFSTVEILTLNQL